MKDKFRRLSWKIALCAPFLFIFFSVSGYLGRIGYEHAVAFAQVLTNPAPLLGKGHPVDWWFVFKFNSSSFPGCGENTQRDCLFGGTVKDYQGHYGQQFVYASSDNPSLQKGSGCIGDTLKDPVGGTFDQIYNGSYFYVIWNDQFYGDPHIKGCGDSCNAPWGHSKGMLSWNEEGAGFVMQVSTPSWPASGSSSSPRTDGNTLGCVDDNNVRVSQHFFALKLSKDDVVMVLQAVQNASVVTDPTNLQIVRNGGPSDIKALVKDLGKKSNSTTYTKVKLSSGVELISKPSKLPVPPWQLISATLNGVPLRTATWWAHPEINTTTSSTHIPCWNQNLSTPGPVEIATTGEWNGTSFSLKGGTSGNHAKLGVSKDADRPYAIFGDLNQQGALSGNCSSSQNGRGGTFYLINNKILFDGLTSLIKGETAKETIMKPTATSVNKTQWCFAWPAVRKSVGGKDKAALVNASRWNAGDVITISFLDGDPVVQQKVQNAALAWTAPQLARLTFDFRKNTTKTLVRISFRFAGSWSVIGTTCRQITDNMQPTMNFGWLTPESADDEVQRVVLHEFGHALGLIHEHQTPAGGIQWNRDAVIRDLSGPPNNWTFDVIEHNMFEPYAARETNFTKLDPQSIMMYPIPSNWTKDGFSVGLNSDLSPTDRKFIGEQYK